MYKINAIDFQIFLLRFGLNRFLNGFYYFKWLEYPLVYNHLQLKRKERYLDVGSGKSVFPLFALVKSRCFVHIADDQSIIKDSLSYYYEIIRRMGLGVLLGRYIYIHKTERGTMPEFADNYFDKISCISTLEHIRDNGDSIMMQSLSRVLRPGGRLVITFPFDRRGNIEEEAPEGVGYFQRMYSIPEIKRRIIEPSGLETRKVIYFAERYSNIGKLYRQNRFRRIHWVMPAFAHFAWKICHAYEGGFRNFCEKEMDRENPGVACVILEKR